MTTAVGTRHASTTVRVRYAETDAMGVVYYANYLVWFEVGRTIHGALDREGRPRRLPGKVRELLG